jgi:murein L,D-transpeptidase YcbB/YkuD
MNKNSAHKRRYLIAAATVLVVGAGAYGCLLLYPPLGPLAGTIAPQLYLDSVASAQIPRYGPYVLIDARSARLYMIESGRVEDTMRVIVGKPETPTPELKSVLVYETLNPYWHVPADLTQTLVAKRMLQEGPSYLTAHGYEVVSAFSRGAQIISPESVDWHAVAAGTAKIFVRQQPGPANSLGRFKFEIPNGDGIYLHDTPKKELFAQEDRSLSHGCVRLEDAQRLARWLLGKDPPVATSPEENIRLPKSVPITISYLDQRSQTQLAALQ